jgi:tetratricopeptide (TPR) repeat protein
MWYISWGELEVAKRMACKALKINPRFPWALYNMMQIHMLSGQVDSASFYLNKARREGGRWDPFVEMAYLALLRGNRELAETYVDSCIQFNQPSIKEFEGFPNEYGARLRMALAYSLNGESQRALEQAGSVRNDLGESMLSIQWACWGFVETFSLVYSLTEQKKEAVRMLDFLVKNNFLTPTFIRMNPWYKDLAGYPAFEELIKD